VVEYIENTKAVAAQRWRTMFGNRVVTAERFPEIIKGTIELDGHKLYPIEVGQADIAPRHPVFPDKRTCRAPIGMSQKCK
jgi:hypothetical protein